MDIIELIGSLAGGLALGAGAVYAVLKGKNKGEASQIIREAEAKAEVFV